MRILLILNVLVAVSLQCPAQQPQPQPIRTPNYQLLQTTTTPPPEIRTYGPGEVAKNTDDDDEVRILVIALSVGFVLILTGILVFIIMKRRRSSEMNEGKPGEYADYYDKIEYKAKEVSTDVYDQAYQ